MPEFPPQTRPYLKMAILELEEVAAKSFSVLWGGKGLRKCVSSGAGAFHSSAPAHISYTSFINERPLPGLSTKCCFWGSKRPVHYSCTKMGFLTQTLQTNGHFQLKCVFVIETLSTNGNFQDCLQNVASGAPNGQLSTFELNLSFFYKLYQRTATSRTLSKMLLLELHMASSLHLN